MINALLWVIGTDRSLTLLVHRANQSPIGGK